MARHWTTTSRPFELTSKRRRGFPSETGVKRGHRSVRGGEKELLERLGNDDRARAARRDAFKRCCRNGGSFRRRRPRRLLQRLIGRNHHDTVAERRGTRLQRAQRRFDSARCLPPNHQHDRKESQ